MVKRRKARYLANYHISNHAIYASEKERGVPDTGRSRKQKRASYPRGLETHKKCSQMQS